MNTTKRAGLFTTITVDPTQLQILQICVADYYEYLMQHDDHNNHNEHVDPTAKLLHKIEYDEKVEDTLLERSSIALTDTERVCGLKLVSQLGGLDLGVGLNGSEKVYFVWHKSIDREQALDLIKENPRIPLVYDTVNDAYSTRVDTDIVKAYNLNKIEPTAYDFD